MVNDGKTQYPSNKQSATKLTGVGTVQLHTSDDPMPAVNKNKQLPVVAFYFNCNGQN